MVVFVSKQTLIIARIDVMTGKNLKQKQLNSNTEVIVFSENTDIVQQPESILESDAEACFDWFPVPCEPLKKLE